MCKQISYNSFKNEITNKLRNSMYIHLTMSKQMINGK